MGLKMGPIMQWSGPLVAKLELMPNFLYLSGQPLGGLQIDPQLSSAQLLRAEIWPSLNLLHRERLQLWCTSSQLISWARSNGWYFQKPQGQGYQWPEFQLISDHLYFWAISILVPLSHRSAVNGLGTYHLVLNLSFLWVIWIAISLL